MNNNSDNQTQISYKITFYVYLMFSNKITFILCLVIRLRLSYV